VNHSEHTYDWPVHLRGSVIVVTGAASGIGRATAAGLHARGAKVIAVDLDGAGLEQFGGLEDLTRLAVDVTDPDHAEQIVELALHTYGRVDAVVANAGIGYVGAFATMPPAQISALLDVNFRAPMLLARAALPPMIEAGHGALVFTSSIVGVLPQPTETAYCASKTALEAFAESLREEVRRQGITVSTIRPGVVRTAFHDKRNSPYGRRFPRPMPPEKIADIIAGMLERGTEHRTVPAWLDVATQAHRRLPWLYGPLARRFGGT
jgi:NAD(P)-dependent dehydrogenase (short-subunit alcohol dehydrogenase family)